MDLLAELESMAMNAAEEDNISNVDRERSQKLFGFTHSEALSALERYRRDVSRIRVANELWVAVKSEKQAEGHDRESYEYSLMRPQKRDSCREYDERGRFILQLAGPLTTPEIIQNAAALNKIPTLSEGVGEDGPARFCEIDGAAKRRLLSWVAKHHCGFQPTIIRLSKAKKELCTHTPAPMLGRNCALPQYRADHADFEPVPSPDQYPVWYFFYGTLADPDVISQHLGLGKTPNYVPAHVTGGRIRTWAGKYKALVEAPGVFVFGSAFLVESRAYEDALRFYETDKYEVVRCQITTQNGVMDGLTFRFDGTERDLD
ncbi:hypothetical protein A1O1_02602 [Capronia coronata CBS 617.96]|uniref:Putative gamma-glutamylcyclotransferase n=1 Tax=Capronia coronata CBS 617.96 TaxID=1182541 RepID=W9ZI70_9EURO|nr:uncharacterized protein A1O1_02602 [Capronia coronata CBS 617.96]EXJ94209.1 hypothetical protein A1O1_02602 [Capronia coronata CBS 617.96]